jgi:hypothetical protein
MPVDSSDNDVLIISKKFTCTKRNKVGKGYEFSFA